MPKTLVIAEKPSVGQDLRASCPARSTRRRGLDLEGPEHVITWAVGHLVQLAEPDEYDAKYKSWRMADLPIVPDHFKLVVRDERSKQADVGGHARSSRRDDVDEVVNACDAGREGELIFAYLYEKAGSQQAGPAAVAELDDQARRSKEAFAPLRPGAGVRARWSRPRGRARRPTGSSA